MGGVYLELWRCTADPDPVLAFFVLPSRLLMSACSLLALGSGGGFTATRSVDPEAVLSQLPVLETLLRVRPSPSLQQFSPVESLSSMKKCWVACLLFAVAPVVPVPGLLPEALGLLVGNGSRDLLEASE